MSTVVHVVTGLDDNRVANNNANFITFADAFDFFVQLTAEDRMAVNAVARLRLPFIQQAHEFANTYQRQLMLSDEALELFNTRMYDYVGLDKLLEKVRVFHEGLDDTVLMIGGNCYGDGLMIKDLAELAIKRGVPGMEHVFTELAQYWERATPAKKDNGTTTPNGGPNPQPNPDKEPV